MATIAAKGVIIPTLMHDYLGVKNALEDYSMGRLLRDASPRTWHLVGSNLNYAFIGRRRYNPRENS